MWLLLLGLGMFLGMHSISIAALALRDRLATKSELGWKALYALVSLIGIVLIVKGYAEFKQTAQIIYISPVWFRHLSALLLLPVFVLFLAPYFPGKIKTSLQHPQLLAVIIWASAHLLVNGSVADVLLFGSFLAWALADLISMRNRATRPVPGAPPSRANDIILLVLGLTTYIVTVLWLHALLLGVKPFG